MKYNAFGEGIIASLSKFMPLNGGQYGEVDTD